jgi:glucan phosphoethanolaminetransferase (alkaline phosphatase superfamily)
LTAFAQKSSIKYSMQANNFGWVKSKRCLKLPAWFLLAMLFALLFLPNLYFLKDLAHQTKDAPVVADTLIASLASVLERYTAFLTAGLLFVLLFAMAKRAWLVALLLAPGAVLLPPELFHLSKFGVPSSSHTLSTVIESNTGEALSWLGLEVIIAWVSCVVMAVAMLLIVRALRRSGLQWHHRSRKLVLITLLPAFILLLSAELASTTFSQHSEPIAGIDTYHISLAGELRNAYPWGVPLRLYDFLAHRAEIKKHLKNIEGFRFGARVNDLQRISKRQIYVFVVGESTRADHLGANGYARQTTPRLDATEGVVFLRDVIAPVSASRIAVPMLLTRRTAVSGSSLFKERSIISAFKEAGFRTYWVSTQSNTGFFDSPIGLIAKEADESFYINPVRYQHRGAHDGELIAYVQKLIKRNEEKLFIVLHTLGSHASYHHRYPSEFEMFKPAFRGDEIADIWNIDHKERLINSYDNSVLYLDYVFAELIGTLQAASAISGLIYSSDHGETLFEGTCGKAGHGFISTPNQRVAALAWMSKPLRALAPHAVDALSRNAVKPATLNTFFFSTLDLAGIDFPDFNASKSLLRPEYAPSPRIVSGDMGERLDFDSKAFHQADCAAQTVR